jgi:hypothetical protein
VCNDEGERIGTDNDKDGEGEGDEEVKVVDDVDGNQLLSG